jgi:RNA polymerase sigma-70 factor (ECF subfamily)
MDATTPSLLEQLWGPEKEAAWKGFVDLYSPLLCHWARGLGLHGADATGLVENVFAVVANNLHQFHDDRGQPFRKWLSTKALEALHSRRQMVCERQATESEIDTVPMTATPGALAENEYRHYLVQRALELIRADFEPVTWTAFCQSAVGGQQADEVARELGISVLAVYLTKARVLRRLRNYLEGLLD